MNTDLMGASRFKLQAQEAKRTVSMDDLIVSDGKLAQLIIRGDKAFAIFGIARQIRANGSGIFSGLAKTKSVVFSVSGFLFNCFARPAWAVSFLAMTKRPLVPLSIREPALVEKFQIHGKV